MVLDAIMLGLGFVGGIVYLAAYLSLMRGWISGMSYLFHGTSVISCMIIAVSSSLCSLAIGGNEYDFCVHWRCLHNEKSDCTISNAFPISG